MDEFSASLKEGLVSVGSMSIKGFDRAKQFSQEKMGNAVRTEYDQDYMTLANRVESTQRAINGTSNASRNFLQPNAAARLEDMFNEKVTALEGSANANVKDLASKIPIRKGSAIDKRTAYSEILGNTMKQGGYEIGDQTAIGQSLIDVGSTFEKIGFLEKEYLQDVYSKFFQPFSSHLQTDWANITTEKRRLDLARLDLDAAKSKVRGARTPETMRQHEQKVRECQAAFDSQYEKTKILLADADRRSSEFTVHLEEFIRSQMNYHEQAHKMLEESYAKMQK